jgi:hypothetical protein
MIPAIEDIFHILSRGEMTFSGAEMYVREHIRLAANNGVKLRDHFAGLAMSGLVGAWGAHDIQDYTEIASDAYTLADAMLKERFK